LIKIRSSSSSHSFLPLAPQQNRLQAKKDRLKRN